MIAAGGDEVAAAAGREHDLRCRRRRFDAAAEVDLRAAERSVTRLPADLDARLAVGDAEQLDAVDGLPDGERARLAVDDQQRLVARGCRRATTVCAAAAARGERRQRGQQRLAASIVRMRSVPEVGERERQVGDFLADQRHRRLQVVALGAGDAHRVALDRGLHLQLALLDQRLDLLRGVAVDAALDAQRLLDLVAADLLDLGAASRGSARRRCAWSAWRAGCRITWPIWNSLSAKSVSSLLLSARRRCARRALEVEARADLLAGLVDGVAHLDEIGFENGVEAGHDALRRR